MWRLNVSLTLVPNGRGRLNLDKVERGSRLPLGARLAKESNIREPEP